MKKRKLNRTIIALKRCIGETFDQSKWKELAYLTNGSEIIDNHPRLLRSLYFGDDDYEDCIFSVLKDLITQESENLQLIVDYVNLPEWLKEHDEKEYKKLYENTEPLLEVVDEISVSNSFELSQYIERIRFSVESDPELAVGSTKEMLESVLKIIVEGMGEQQGQDDVQKLLKRVQLLLKLHPDNVAPDPKGRDIVMRILSNLGQVVVGLNELRNLYGTGHGRSRRSSITPRHARLVVGAGSALAVFLMETFEFHINSRNSSGEASSRRSR